MTAVDDTETMAPQANVIWERPDSGGRADALSLDRIASACVALADAEGPDAITVERVAARLNVSAATLRRHTRDRLDLLDLLLDAVYREIDLPGQASAGWREDIRAIAAATRVVLRRHLWFAAAMASRPMIGPSALAHIEAALAAVDGGNDLDIRLVTSIVDMVMGHVFGSAMLEYEEAKMQAARTGLIGGEEWSDQKWHSMISAYLDRVVAGGGHPTFARFIDAGARHADPDEVFELGLECLLDGVEPRRAAGLTPRE